MNKQVIAAVLGGLVIGGAAFIPMEVAALQAPAASTADNKVAEEKSDAGAPGADEVIDTGSDGTAGTASSGGTTTPAPIAGPTFGSGDDDDDEGDEDHDDRDGGDDDHEDSEDEGDDD
ncbi:MAG: hypothetical protein RL140_546 [Actinomycetota bacterium]|jgi:hypothetical protein